MKNHHGYQPVLFNLLPLLRLLLRTQNVFPLHADLKTLAQSTVFTEPTIGQVHTALLVIETFEVLLTYTHINYAFNSTLLLTVIARF